VRIALSPRAAFAIIAIASGLLLVLRSRPLERFSGGIEPLLYASGLTVPRGLVSLPDGTILALDGVGASAQVVEVGVDGTVTPIGGGLAPAAALLAQPGIWAIAEGSGGVWYATVPDEGRLVAIDLGGAAPTVRVVASFAGENGAPNPRPTGIAVSPMGAIYVAFLATQPGKVTSGAVVIVQANGRWKTAFDGLTLPVGLGFDNAGQLHVLELAERYDDNAARAVPKSGRLMTLGPESHQRRTIARRLDRPAGMVFTPAGDLYLSESAYGTGEGEARLLRVPAQGLLPGA
jgi:hypothetical protein